MSDHRFVAALEAIYDAALDPDSWPDALTRISEWLDCAGANLFYQRDNGSFGLITSKDFPAGALDEYHSEWWKYDLRSHRGMSQEYTHWRAAQCDHDLLTEEEIENAPFYSVYLRKYALKLFMAIGVSPDPRVRVALSVQFPLGRGRATEQDLSHLERIAPHVENALRLSLRIQNSNLIRDGLERALDGLDIGTLLLDARGQVLFANAVAKDVFGAQGLLPGQVPRFGDGDVQRTAMAAVDRLLTGDIEDDVLRPVLLSDADRALNAVLYAMPVNTSPGIEAAFMADAKVILLAVRTEIGAPPEPALVRDLLGLTLSEARVASLVGFGLTPLQASEKLGIAEETARAALKKVFAKVGVSKQSELTALLTRLVLR